MKKIIWPEGVTDEQKKIITQMMERKSRERSSLWVIYHPDCGCPIEQLVLLDRFPMSEKIISQCPECKKGCLMEISDPIIFHYPLENKDFTLDELKHFIIGDNPQKHLIEAYRFEANIRYLENFCEDGKE